MKTWVDVDYDWIVVDTEHDEYVELTKLSDDGSALLPLPATMARPKKKHVVKRKSSTKSPPSIGGAAIVLQGCQDDWEDMKEMCRDDMRFVCQELGKLFL